jgi:hypothetical protein
MPRLPFLSLDVQQFTVHALSMTTLDFHASVSGRMNILNDIQAARVA